MAGEFIFGTETGSLEVGYSSTWTLGLDRDPSVDEPGGDTPCRHFGAPLCPRTCLIMPRGMYSFIMNYI